jgi:hypothetical protein
LLKGIPPEPCPVPLSEATVGEFAALLVKDAVPEDCPADGGVNVITNWTFCPGGIVTGNDTPLRVNAELLVVPELTVTLAPVALSCAGRFAYDPTSTLPKSKDVGLMTNCPAGAFVPFPVNGIAKFGSDALEVTEMLPPAFPADCGAKLTPKVTCCPGPRTTGGVNPLILKPVPEIAACEIVTVTDWLELVRVSDVA